MNAKMRLISETGQPLARSLAHRWPASRARRQAQRPARRAIAYYCGTHASRLAYCPLFFCSLFFFTVLFSLFFFHCSDEVFASMVERVSSTLLIIIFVIIPFWAEKINHFGELIGELIGESITGEWISENWLIGELSDLIIGKLSFKKSAKNTAFFLLLCIMRLIVQILTANFGQISAKIPRKSKEMGQKLAKKCSRS